ncbi:DNA uptake protein ComE-like DNA-binding protein [Arcicella aurantiaca]|uniref:DNA uptake protein ComE-like DNA-binding protein n=1 Tax=Arcicella aurantiaca TaxID=591202 RepID=A0A316DI64_9BACT|nr:helix-hairpin-helix domain-containing protein [Arcicella aurantiaca]PWK17854.1 DNA uptake protein ComE-like DNA-binding protein [Arcicella aurantiaca]
MFKKLRYYLRDYFAFNNTEIKGFMFLIILIVIFIISIFIFDFLPDKTSNANTIDPKKVEEMMAKIEIKESAKKETYQDRFNNQYEKSDKEYAENRVFKLAPFDPNVASQEQLEQLGIASWMAKRIINYRSKGGQFRKKEDLQRIYDFPTDLYSKLEPYITLPDKTGKPFPTNTKTDFSVESKPVASLPTKESFKPITFDLNRADTNDLKKIKGIGSKLSARIIKYRDMLGGFYSENQVREVYGLDSTVVDEVLKYGTIKNPPLRKIKINEVTGEEFKHYYIRPYVAKSVIAYRQQHGNFSSRKDFENIKLLDAKTLDKIFPYFEF